MRRPPAPRVGIQTKLFASYVAIILVFLGLILACQVIWTRLAGEGAGHGVIDQSLGWTGLVAAAIALPVSWLVAQRITRPLREMSAVARRIAGGDYRARVTPPAPDEIGELACCLNEMAAGLEQIESLRRELVANVAHELRTPLTSIEGYVDGILEGVFPADAATLGRISRHAARLHRLVEDLTTLSRLEAGVRPPDLRPLSTLELADETAEMLRPQFAEKGVQLRVDVPETLPPLAGDKDQITQALVNLLSNALRYTPPGGAVRVTAEHADARIRIAVSDTGCGIKPDDLPHIFERFYRADEARAHDSGGSGVGLAIVRAVVEAHGGAASVSSRPGEGSTFVLDLPVWRERRAGEERARRRQGPPRPVPRGRRDRPRDKEEKLNPA